MLIYRKYFTNLNADSRKFSYICSGNISAQLKFICFMKMIIIEPDGSRTEFKYDQFAEFHHWLFAVLAGIPKRVSIDIDKEFNEIYKIEYA